jgi:hypothetical protein
LRKVFAAVLLCSIAAPPLLPAEERVDLEMITAIRQEGFRDSKVMETASRLMDSIGPRLTGSPNMKRANEWTRKQLADWGLANAHTETWEPFGRGWSYEVATVRMLSPDVAELLALPQAWSPGTNGPIRAKAVKVKLADKDDLEKAKGQLAGKIVLIGDPREVKPQEKALSERYDEKALAELERYEVPGRPYTRAGVPFNREEFAKRREFQRALNKFLADEKVAAVLDAGQLDGGTFRVQGLNNGYRKNAPAGVPTLVMAIEHWERLARILDRKEDVELEVNLKTTFTDEPSAANTIAEIPGTDKKGEIVMVGAHLDSWHGGTGATDNGAGVAASMEAVRILKALNVKPRRTIRIALWSGEEQGLFGSRGYVSQHFASRPPPKEPSPGEDDMPSFLRPPTGPLTIKPEHAKLSAYFNLDNGTGKIRGVYAQENAAVVPIFESWIQPLKDLGVTAVTMRNTSGTDHLSFDAVGLPGFQFIQDEVEYETRTHHTNMDVYERLQKEDLMQASVVIACFVYNAAMRDAMLPRKPMPKDEPAAQPTPGAKGPLAKPESPGGTPEKAPTPAPSPSPRG